MILYLKALAIKDERHLKSFTGLDSRRFHLLLEDFSSQYEQYRQGQLKSANRRKRKPGGGRRSRLPKPEDKLAFILHYHKAYPTFDNLATTFGMSRSSAFNQVHALAPVLRATLESMGVLPKRELASAEELLASLKELGDINTLLIDATERPYRRLTDKQQRDALYSGKKSDLR